LGLNHPKYNPFINTLGVAYSIIIPLIFALMPISMYLGWIK
jgi:succinate dehydrogenase / fumarate reductase, cytochrome b subunit